MAVAVGTIFGGQNGNIYIYLSATEPELGIMQNAMVEAAALRQILAHDLT